MGPKSLGPLTLRTLGVLHTVIQGRAAAAAANRRIAKFWLDAAGLELAVHPLRVEPFANLADGPTRDDTSLMALCMWNLAWRGGYEEPVSVHFLTDIVRQLHSDVVRKLEGRPPVLGR